MDAAADALLHRLLDLVVATDLEDPPEDFVSVGVAMLALAVSKLPAKEREEVLLGFEFGTLRKAVELFRRPTMAHNGAGWFQ